MFEIKSGNEGVFGENVQWTREDVQDKRDVPDRE